MLWRRNRISEKVKDTRKTVIATKIIILLWCKEEKEDNSLDWVKEVEEREKFYTQLENDEEKVFKCF